MKTPVFLLGMMGAGKTSVGSVLAEHYQVPFVDLDRRVERMFGCTVQRLFDRGEPTFRRAERVALESLVAEPGFAARPAVVATGGGIVTDPANLATMEAVGTTILLEISPAQAAKRLSDPVGRPLLAGARSQESQLQRLWAQREAAYRRCRYTVDAAASPREVVGRVIQLLGESGQS